VTEVDSTTRLERTVSQDKRQYEQEFKALTTQLENFDEVGVRCSSCGQEVTAAYAERERRTLTEKIQTLQAKVNAASSEQLAAATTLTVAQSQLKALQAAQTQRNTWSVQLETLRTAGITHTVIELQTQLAALGREFTVFTADQKHHREEDTNAKNARSVAEATLKSIETGLNALVPSEQKLREAGVKARTELELLQTELQRVWPESTVGDAVQSEAEFRALQRANVQAEYAKLQEGLTLRDEWKSQLLDFTTKAERLPEAARCSEAQAAEAVKTAKHNQHTAEAAWHTAHADRTKLSAQYDRLAKLLVDIQQAETETNLHIKLDTLLGKSGLQRELVREAETEIVRLANSTLGALTGGEFSLELDENQRTDDKALVLQTRRVDVSEPTAVEYLSGSQKFRVAISIALAIGQFSSGQDRPLESVIIDEGFGSLDRDGLRATADELNKLKGLLKRIILVSHQEDFTEHFPVMYQLSKGDGSGTIATKVRR